MGTVRFLLRLRQDLYEALQDIAAREHRSTNGQIVHIIERFVNEERDRAEGKWAT
jgi:hypothetical protein